MTVNEALAVTFPDVSIKHGIGIGLFKNTLTTLGTERHQRFIDAAWNNKVSIPVEYQKWLTALKNSNIFVGFSMFGPYRSGSWE